MMLPAFDPSWLDLVGIVVLGQFFQALLGGISEGSRSERAAQTEQANKQAELENRILLELAKSPDSDIASMALTGLLTGNQTKAGRKGGAKGLGGFVTEIQENPILGPLQALLQTPAQEARPGVPDVEGFLGSSGVTTPIDSPNAPGAAAQAPRGTVENVPGQSPVQQLPPFQPVGPTTTETRPTSRPGLGGTEVSITPGQPTGEPIERPQQVGLPGFGPVPQTPDQPEIPRQVFRTEAFDEAETTRARIETRVAAFIEAGVDPSTAAAAAMAAEGAGSLFSRTGQGGLGMRSVGTTLGSQLPPGQTDVFGREIDPAQTYNTQILPDLSIIATPIQARTGRTGVDMERAAQILFQRPVEQLQPEEMQAALQFAIENRQAFSFAGGMGSGLASLEIDQARLLTPGEALAMQTTFGITRGQAAQLSQVPLTPQQAQSAGASFAFTNDVVQAKELFRAVWPREQQPEARRLALITLQREQNPQFVTLLGLLRRMPIRLAVMEQGSRPSDVDVSLFRSGLPQTASDNFSLIDVPTSFEAGLALLDAADRIGTTSRSSIGLISPAERQRRAREVQGRDGGPPDLGNIADDPDTISFDDVIVRPGTVRGQSQVPQ